MLHVQVNIISNVLPSYIFFEKEVNPSLCIISNVVLPSYMGFVLTDTRTNGVTRQLSGVSQRANNKFSRPLMIMYNFTPSEVKISSQVNKTRLHVMKCIQDYLGQSLKLCVI